MLCMSFFLPWKLVVFYCLILGLPVILLMLLGKNNGKTRAESVMMGWKVRLLNLYQCVGFGFARLIGRFIISTSKLASGNSSLCCFDSLSYLLAPFLVFLPSRLSTKYRGFLLGFVWFVFLLMWLQWQRFWKGETRSWLFTVLGFWGLTERSSSSLSFVLLVLPKSCITPAPA